MYYLTLRSLIGTIYHQPIYRQVANWGGINPQQIASLWLRSLPLRADETEAKVAHSQLCDLVESNDPYVMGENNAHVFILIRIIADLFLEAQSQSQSNTVTSLTPTTSTNVVIASNYCVDNDAGLSHRHTRARLQSIMVNQLKPRMCQVPNWSSQLQASFTLPQQQILQQLIA